MNLVNIAFQGGTHGNFLMFFIDKFSRNTKDIEGTPFTENHTSHVQLDFSGNVRHYHPSDEKPFFENINEPHILITIDKEDLKYIERWATIRAGDQKVDTSHDHTVVNSSFLEQFKWKEPFMQLYNIDLSSKQNIPKFLMRDYYKMMFLDPNKNGYIERDKIFRANKPKNTFEFPVSSFWDESKFYDKIKEIDELFGLELDVYDKSIYTSFKDNIHFMDTRDRVDNVITCIKDRKNIQLQNLDTVEQAYISAWIEQTFDHITVPLQNNFFKDTLEICEWIEYYPQHYKAMNPNLPTFNGIPNPFHLWNLKK
tara:strand:- start:1516 stop:2448 length:933 start_codon:yes stop_codon:yes gene_type:complete